MKNIAEVLTRGVAEVLPDRKTLAEIMGRRKIRLYLGIDPTGAILTLGHSIVLRKLQQFAQLGHEVILLIGNGTVQIGDPTGRDSTRPMLSDEEIEKNFQNWKSQASKILNFDLITIKHNGDWLNKLTLKDIIKLMAKTTVGQLIERDMFQQRIKNKLPIFGHEIIYPLLQGYDSVIMDVDLEIGGTDQTFNMMMGRTLQKLYHNKEKWVLTTPIINGLDGRKMSKSYNNFIALTENPITMYGKLMKIPDEMIIDYFTLLTDVPLDEIETIAKELTHQNVNPMEYKKQLAHTITVMYHTKEDADLAQNEFERVVQDNGIPQSMPVCRISMGNHNQIEAIELLLQCKAAKSKSDAKRLIQQKAVTIDNQIIKDWHTEIRIKDGAVIKAGKHNFVKIAVETK